ncbi:MAG: GNAT family N-acetyltransferase [Gemmatimonadetes bacterium]|jgi:predicted acetyltransferase|nr:GNAT family N-acetyltransferase [Gemmatimonadota bacterium]
MSEEIVRLTAADFEDGMDFLNLVFGAYGPQNFETLLPAIYQPTEEWMSCNWAVRKNGKIRAIVGLFPIQWHIGEALFKVAGIGGVSTHPKSRGAGYMKSLMSRCLDEMRDGGYHLSYLGGQRQRYQHYRYERCGVSSSFGLNKSNLRHCFDDDPGIHFEPLEKEDTERLARARELHGAQPMHCLRSPANFHNHLRNWHRRPHAALDREGRMVGYLVAGDKGDQIDELVSDDDDTAMRLLRAWTADRTDWEVSISLPPTHTNLARLLGRCCETTSLRPAGNWRISPWAELIDALLKMRRLSGPLLEGRVVVDIREYGSIALQVEGERTTCERTDDEPTLQCDSLAAMRLLFGPLPPSKVVPLPSAAILLEQWCPLPLYWPRQDGV